MKEKGIVSLLFTSLFLLLFASGFYIGKESLGTPSAVVADREHTTLQETTNTHHHEGTYQVPDDVPAPTVKLFVEKDSKAGYNLHIETTNFKFTPENANKENVMGEGHAHIFINGEKLGRLYGNWYHLKTLPEGSTEITVNLTANGHESYSVGDKEVEDTVTVEVSSTSQPAMH